MAPLLVAAALALAAADSPPARVYVGVYLLDVSDLDLKAGRFKADARVWLKWKGGEAPPPVLFDNGELEVKEELSREAEGDWRTVQWRVQGTFRGEFPVHDFPFDTQALSLDFSLPATAGDLVPDLAASGMAQPFSITGWTPEAAFRTRTDAHRYASDFGSIAHEGDVTTVERVRFVLALSRPIEPYLLKFLVPLGIIVLMALLALFLPVDKLDVRSALGVTAVLSCVAFHFSQAQTLPEVSYLVAADKLFLGSYLLCIVTLLVTVAGYNLEARRPRLVRRLDRTFAVVTPVLAVWGVLSLLGRPAAPEPVEPPAPPPTAQSTRATLRLGVTTLKTPTSAGLGPVFRRYLSMKDARGASAPLLVTRMPEMTNDLVRLLPDGGMVVRWVLRQQLAWSDGAPLTAADLVASLEVSPRSFRRAVHLVDERTVEVEYVDRRPDYLTALWVMPRVVREAAGAPDAGSDVATKAANLPSSPTAGPFVLEAFEAEQRAVFVRNPHFAGARPAFERVEVKVFPSSKEIVEALRAGELDAAPGLSAQGAALLAGDTRFVVHAQPGELIYQLQVDPAVPALQSAEARRALVQAIDRDALAQLFSPVPGLVAQGLVPASRALDVPHAPAEAKATLARLGLSGTTVRLTSEPLVAGSTPALVVDRVTADLTAVGLVVQRQTSSDTGALFFSRRHGGLLFSARSADLFARMLSVPYVKGEYVTADAVPGFFDGPMPGLVTKLSTTLYVERREALMERLSEEWAQRLPVLPLVFAPRLAVARADLEGPDFGEAESFLWNVEAWRARPAEE